MVARLSETTERKGDRNAFIVHCMLNTFETHLIAVQF